MSLRFESPNIYVIRGARFISCVCVRVEIHVNFHMNTFNLPKISIGCLYKLLNIN